VAANSCRGAKYVSKSLQWSPGQEDITDQFPHFIHTGVAYDELDFVCIQEQDRFLHSWGLQGVGLKLFID